MYQVGGSGRKAGHKSIRIIILSSIKGNEIVPKGLNGRFMGRSDGSTVAIRRCGVGTLTLWHLVNGLKAKEIVLKSWSGQLSGRRDGSTAAIRRCGVGNLTLRRLINGKALRCCDD